MEDNISRILVSYDCTTQVKKENALREALQLFVLDALSKTDFFEHAAFYGGTCLRIFHGLERFSEDLDFGLTGDDPSFNLEHYVEPIKNAFLDIGCPIEMYVRDKAISTRVLSGYLESNKKDLFEKFFPGDPENQRIIFNQKLKVKIDVSSNYVPDASYEWIRIEQPIPLTARCYDFPSLCAGKMGAVLTRGWGNRIKGRDFFDFLFYVQKDVPINMKYLHSQLIRTGTVSEDDPFSPDIVKALLSVRFMNVNYSSAKMDAASFVPDVSTLDKWSADYFCSFIDQLSFS